MTVAALVVTALALWARPAPPADGLLGRYFATSDWSGEPVLERIDTTLSTEALAATPEVRELNTFSVEWTGSLVVRRDGIYGFATKSDDGSWLWIGDQLVIDNGGAHSVRNVATELLLKRGVYPFKLRYNQVGGDYFLQVGQTDPVGRVVHPGPLVSRRMSYSALRARELWPLGVVAIWYASLASLVISALRIGRALPVCREVAEIWSDRWVRWVVGLGMIASAAHIAYGLPAIPSFSADELEAVDTLVASETGFRDWNLRWPPLHAFLIAGILQPFAWGEALFGLRLVDDLVIASMHVLARGLSVLLVGLSLMLTFDGTRMISDRRAGYLAATLLACSPLVVFFGSLSNLEIPHLFWVTATFWVWLKLLRYRNPYWFAIFGAAVGLSLASKDQAYGYYLLAPFALIALVGHEQGARGARAWLRTLSDRRLVYVVLTALAGMAIGHALPWRFDRFVERLAVITGPASVQYQMFPATVRGHLALLATTAKCFVWAAGVPLTVAFVGGVVEFARKRRALHLLSMMAPAVTYYASFLAVILYVYDRFLIGWLPIAAAIGGVFLTTMLRVPPKRLVIGPIIVFIIVAAGIANAIAMNVVFYRDPRHAAWRWLQLNVPCGSSIGVTFNGRYIPPLDCYDMWELAPDLIDGMVRWPRYLVLNEALLQRFSVRPSGLRFLERLESGDLGYRRVLRVESDAPFWAPLYWEERFRNRREDIETTSDKPLHAIEVWECSSEGCNGPRQP